MQPLTDAAVIALVPGLVEIAKRTGMPARFAGLAAIAFATAVFALSGLATGSPDGSTIAEWLLRGTIAGLAAAGLYSQAIVLTQRPSTGPRDSTRSAAR
jgi:hypothetical protein